MNPFFQRIQVVLPELPSPWGNSARHWQFDVALAALGPAFYNKAVPLHLVLHLDYSILCNELHEDLSVSNAVNRRHLLFRLEAALLYCELLEHLYQHYLVVPREVEALRAQRIVLRQLLVEYGSQKEHGYTFATPLVETNPANLFSPSFSIRNQTTWFNWGRILANRSNRTIDLSVNVIHAAPRLQRVIRSIEAYVMPSLAYLNFVFHLPRLLVNNALVFKHLVPGPWMHEKERTLFWSTRLYSQIQRRWFETGNDVVWTAVSALNLFVLVGAWAPAMVYVSTLAFAFDAVNAIARASIEWGRLYALQQAYQEKYEQETDGEQKKVILHHLQAIEKRIVFEHERLRLGIINMVTVFLGMILVLPWFATPPAVLFVSALCLLALWGAVYVSATNIEARRPPERLGFFARPQPVLLNVPRPDDEHQPEDGVSHNNAF